MTIEPYGQIYAIIDPTISSIAGGYIKYLGKHKFNEKKEGTLEASLEKYLSNKINCSARYFNRNPNSKNPQMLWFRDTSERNIYPIIKCVEICYSSPELSTREIYWIAYYRERYSDLLNRAPGGAGGSFIGHGKGTKRSDESKQHLKEAQNRPERLKANSERMSGTNNSMYGKDVKDYMTLEAYEEKLKKQRETLKTPESKKRQRQSHIGKSLLNSMTKEEIQQWKNNISKALKGREITWAKKISITKKNQHLEPWNKGHTKNTDPRVAKCIESWKRTIKKRKTYIGENNPNAKLTNIQVEEIKIKWLSGKYTRKQLQEEYNVVKPNRINGIINSTKGK